jgi:hypothetical protein
LALHIVHPLGEDLGADVNQATFAGRTPLNIAARYGMLDLVVCLVQELGADVHRQALDGTFPLLTAASGGHVDIVRYLCKVPGTDVNQVGDHEAGCSSIFAAAENGHIDVVRCLRELGADVNLVGLAEVDTAITIAAFNGHVDVVRYLLDPEIVSCLESYSPEVETLHDDLTRVKYEAEERISLLDVTIAQRDEAIRSLESQLMDSEKREQNGILEQKRLRKSAKTQLAVAIEHEMAAMERCEEMRKQHEESARVLVQKHSEAAMEREEMIKKTEDKQREEAAVVLREALEATRTLAAVTEQSMGLDDADLRELKRRVHYEEIRRERAAAAAEVRQCDICFDRDKDTVFNCGHLACGECASGLRKCHLCQALIMTRWPIFM